MSLPLSFVSSVEASSPDFWYALQTFHCREEKLEAYFLGLGLQVFLPRLHAERMDAGGNLQRVLVPAVHNLLFLGKTFPVQQIPALMSDSPYPFRVLRRKDTGAYYEIADREMLEFRAVCDPSYRGTVYMDSSRAEARPGSPVRVVHGPFKGLTGKLTRYKGRYYVVVQLATLGVLVHIPKWYCEKL